MSIDDAETTFLFTDIEGSTRLWEQQPEAMRVALARHDAILNDAIREAGGRVFKTIGDAFCAAFSDPAAAVQAILAAQQRLQAEEWQAVAPTIRAGVHAGWAEERAGDYFGPTLNRVARLMAIGHGGQTLVSGAVAERIHARLADTAFLRDLGEHRLKDLQQPERVWQLCHPGLPIDFPPLRSLNLLQHNLPVQRTAFVGRERALEEVKEQLRRARLLTLTGSGGCGKTRLALQLAADTLEEYPEGVWLAELAALSEPGDVASAIAQSLGVREEPGRSLIQSVADYAKGRSILLLLDNCEHLLDACAHAADTVLRSCPNVKIVATSRAALGIDGEHIYRTPSLSHPDSGARARAETLLRCEAANLFLDRVRAHRPEFALTNANAPAVAHVCRQLDGIPLALELAAARLRAMPIDQLAARLDDRFRLLTGGSRTAMPRHQTLRATIDWSFDLLGAQELLLMRRLSVFAGGWSLEAAEAVCADDSGEIESFDVMDLLSSLVDKSLVAYDDLSGRYSLLGTVRQYAAERMAESTEAPQVRVQHCRYYADLATAPQPGSSDGDRYAAVRADYENIRSAVEGLLQTDACERAGQVCVALAEYWEAAGRFGEGQELIERCLSSGASVESTGTGAALLTAAGWLCRLRGDYERAETYQRSALALSNQSGDRDAEANALNNLALIAQDTGRTGEAHDLFHQSLHIARELGDEAKQAARLSNLGMLETEAGNYPAARQYIEEALAVYERRRDRLGMAACLCNMADVALREKDAPEAEALTERCIALFKELQYRPGIASSLANLAQTSLLRGDLAAADGHIGEALAVCRDADMPGLLPFLLELRAECLSLQQRQALALRAIVGADRLRERVGQTRSQIEQDRVDAVLARGGLEETARTQHYSAAASPAEILDEATRIGEPEIAR